ncbi:hypothetical protein BU23DRAFT_548567 [Bimuria novae-zelandiae CBS 107.79]|uniref:Uncharacterized protein n=1 Tax=Bimuria novae-zelandiae CBS 107.79 TaxID=1447943 RepID=A0A6A5VV00_9PLEO|nr:hypothetical protein BU23DRAFT_548567 [Bimuria novae-zelandiae CBS 107.79]
MTRQAQCSTPPRGSSRHSLSYKYLQIPPQAPRNLAKHNCRPWAIPPSPSSNRIQSRRWTALSEHGYDKDMGT